MKYSFLFSAFILFVTNVSPLNSAAETISPSDVSSSDCLRGVSRAGEDDMEETLKNQWSFEYSGSTLTLIWHNLIANCCPEGFGANINREGNTLTFSAYEIGSGMCDCYCPFDITSTFEGIEPGHYKILFATNNRILYSAEIDIFDGVHGNMIMPAGIHELTSDHGILSISADGILTAEADGDFTIEIFDLSGQLCARLTSTGSAEISLNSLASGFYIAKAKHNGRTSTLRFLR